MTDRFTEAHRRRERTSAQATVGYAVVVGLNAIVCTTSGLWSCDGAQLAVMVSSCVVSLLVMVLIYRWSTRQFAAQLRRLESST